MLKSKTELDQLLPPLCEHALHDISIRETHALTAWWSAQEFRSVLGVVGHEGLDGFGQILAERNAVADGQLRNATAVFVKSDRKSALQSFDIVHPARLPSRGGDVA